MPPETEVVVRITELQDRIIHMLAEKPSVDSWVEIVVNFEIVPDEAYNAISFAIYEKDGTWTKDYIQFGFEEQDLFVELQRLYADVNDAWSTIDLRLFSDGQFSFDFDYGPPRRINGVEDEQSRHRFTNYLNGYQPPIAEP